MRIFLNVDVTAAIKAGHNNSGERILTFDPGELAEPQRHMLARKVTTATAAATRWDADADCRLAFGPGPTQVVTVTLAELLRVLDESVAAEAVEAARAARESAAHAERLAAEDAEIAARPVGDLLHFWGGKLQPREYGDGRPRSLARRPEVQAECDRLNAAREADATAAATAKAAKLAALRTWAEAHGGETTRLRLEEGMPSWVSSAASEYVDARQSELFTDGVSPTIVPGDGWDCDDEPLASPTAAQILALRQVRSRLREGETATLQRMTYTAPDDEDGDGPAVVQDEIEIAIPVPGAGTRLIFAATPR